MWPYPDGFRRFQADKEMEGGSSELPNSMGVQSRQEPTDVLNANSKGSQGTHNDRKSSRGIQQEPLQRCDDVCTNAQGSNSRGAVKNRFMGSETYRGNLDEAVRTHQEDMHLSSRLGGMVDGLSTRWTNLPEFPEQT